MFSVTPRLPPAHSGMTEISGKLLDESRRIWRKTSRQAVGNNFLCHVEKSNPFFLVHALLDVVGGARGDPLPCCRTLCPDSSHSLFCLRWSLGSGPLSPRTSPKPQPSRSATTQAGPWACSCTAPCAPAMTTVRRPTLSSLLWCWRPRWTLWATLPEAPLQGHIQRLLRSSSQQGAASATTAANFPQALRSALEANNTAYTLRAASALFTKQVAALDQNFLKKAKSGGGVGLNHVALGSGGKQPDSATFHTWALGATGGAKVAQLSKEPQAQSGALILANALRFKGLWERGFGESSEDLRTFLGDKYTRVPMMHRSGILRHYEDVENMVQVLELGLWGGQASMLLLLPFHVEGLDRLDKLLSLELLRSWHSKLANASVALSLPRVNLSSSLNLQCSSIVYLFS
ncbi:hypothetical protein ACEWY4_024819 [Coilia grayii]|uniref:Serpin domain-containing protein n=1 Tax=Coilia grayii TaxID=363190 RepID=A0ABD1IXU8_9TELE